MVTQTRMTSSSPLLQLPVWCCRSERLAIVDTGRGQRASVKRRRAERSSHRWLVGTSMPAEKAGVRWQRRSGLSAMLRSWRHCWLNSCWWTSLRSQWICLQRSRRPKRSSTTSGQVCSRCSEGPADLNANIGIWATTPTQLLMKKIALSVSVDRMWRNEAKEP